MIYPIDEFCSALKFKKEHLERLVKIIPGEVYDLKLSVLWGSDDEHAQELLPSLKEQWPDDLRLKYLTLKPGIDAYEIFFQRLEVLAEGDRQPDIVVVNVRHAADRERIERLLYEADQKAGHRLACIVISPKGTTELDESVTRDRLVRCLPSPTAISSILEAVLYLQCGLPTRQNDAA